MVQSYLQIHGARPRPSSKVDLDPAIDEPIGRALAVEPAHRFASAHDFIEALRAVIEPAAAGGEQDVLALYVEGGPVELARASAIATGAGMTIAMAAPDSLIAVAYRASIAAPTLAARLEEIATTAKVALGASRATIVGSVVDGPALDVEGWAPYPLEVGLWLGSDLT